MSKSVVKKSIYYALLFTNLNYDDIVCISKRSLDNDLWRNTHNADTMEFPQGKETTIIIH